jgi:hypothetical protein
MHKINKDFFPTETHVQAFNKLCSTLIDERTKHDQQMVMVKKTAGLDANDPKKYQPYPAPSVHPDVDASVVKNGDRYEIQYELFDDKTLDDKKNNLIRQVTEQAVSIQEKIMPMRKRMLFEMQVNAINHTIASSVSTGVTREEATAALSVEDRAQLQRNEKFVEQNRAITFHLATLQSDIHDLSERDIATYKPKAFPEV